jgi:alpha-1,3-fucosyltransferase 10
MDYRLTSDVPLPYLMYDFDFSRKSLPFGEKNGFGAVFISNCRAINGRATYIHRLMQYIPIDSYGKCFRNETLTPPLNGSRIWKQSVITRYKFVLTFENSDEWDYVTKKVYHALEMGSIPIYWGSDHIEGFVPTQSTIDAKQFSGPEELASYIRYLAGNETAYNEYLVWKNGDYGIRFNHFLLYHRPLAPVCRLILRIHNLWVNPYLTVWSNETYRESGPISRACAACFDSYSGPLFHEMFLPPKVQITRI